jgi:hypothetical protein
MKLKVENKLAFNDPEFEEIEDKCHLLLPAPHLTHLHF